MQARHKLNECTTSGTTSEPHFPLDHDIRLQNTSPRPASCSAPVSPPGKLFNFMHKRARSTSQNGNQPYDFNFLWCYTGLRLLTCHGESTNLPVVLLLSLPCFGRRTSLTRACRIIPIPLLLGHMSTPPKQRWQRVGWVQNLPRTVIKCWNRVS